MSTVYQCFQNFIPQVISHGEDFYQETLRGTEKEALVPALIARASYDSTWLFGQYIPAYLHNRILIGLGLSWAFCSYKGLQERTWMGEWAALAFIPSANAVVDYMTSSYPDGYNHYNTVHDSKYLSKKSNERLNFALKTLVCMTQACVLYKLKGDRNLSLPLKPYLYYGAGIALLTQLKSRYANDVIQGRLSTLMSRDKSEVINNIASRFLLGSLVAYAVGRYTGETIQISRKWEALGSLSAYLATKVLS